MGREIWLLIHKVSLNYIIFKMLQVITYNKIIHAENILYMLIFRHGVQWSTNITTVVSEKKRSTKKEFYSNV